nr:hypothetical protein [Tanacetum cinerariifolium]
VGDNVDTNMLTMEQYLALIQDNIRQGIVKPEIDGDVKFEINGNLMRELRRRHFKDTDDEDAHEHEKADQLTKTVLTDTSERVKVKMKIGKNDIKGPVPHDLPIEHPYVQPMPFPGNLMGQKGNLYKIHEAVYMIGIPAKTHKENNRIDNGCDIMVKDVKRLRQMITPTIHTVPNLEPVVQMYMPLSPFRDKVNVVREEEQDNDIPLQNGVMQPLTPQTAHITPPDDVASATSPFWTNV